tara:strand:- start:19569 stop:19925 length:357 start_codon:yes stop_codon:yes gene_type:complete
MDKVDYKTIVKINDLISGEMRQSTSSGVVTGQDKTKATMGLYVVKRDLDLREEHKKLSIMYQEFFDFSKKEIIEENRDHFLKLINDKSVKLHNINGKKHIRLESQCGKSAFINVDKLL